MDAFVWPPLLHWGSGGFFMRGIIRQYFYPLIRFLLYMIPFYIKNKYLIHNNI
jgi:hypothetical protein